MEVDNWQFAWAEEQKKACCKTVGLGSPGKCVRERETWAGFSNLDGGKECGVILVGASKRKKHQCFFF